MLANVVGDAGSVVVVVVVTMELKSFLDTRISQVNRDEP